MLVVEGLKVGGGYFGKTSPVFFWVCIYQQNYTYKMKSLEYTLSFLFIFVSILTFFFKMPLLLNLGSQIKDVREIESVIFDASCPRLTVDA